ncbi:MAG: hypothetical protein AB8G86_13885 [Saprospiraceae bacterium]
MKKGKFIALVQTLDKKEVKTFTNYLHGNYGAKTQLLLVYDYVLKHVKKNQLVQLQTALVEKKYFTNKGIAPVVVTNKLSKLSQYLMEFLLWEKMKQEKDRIEVQKMELEILKERQLTDRFYKGVKKAIKKFEQTTSSWQDLNLLYLHELNAYNSDGNQYKHNRLDAAMHHLDNFYATFKLKYAFQLLNRSKILEEQHKIWLFEAVKTYAQQADSAQNPYLHLYYLIIQLLETEQWETFLKLENHFYHFSFEKKSEQLILLTILVNFLIKTYRNGQIENAARIFELHDFGLKERLMISNNTFPPMPFKNIAAIACILGKFDWAKAFLEEWGPTLPSSFKKDNHYYTKGLIAFAEKDYQQCLLHFQETNLQNHFYSMEVRTMVIRAQFELGYLTSTTYACNAYEKYLRTNKSVNKNHIIAGLNFIKIMRVLIKKAPIDKITKLLDELSPIQVKAWFLNKFKDEAIE